MNCRPHRDHHRVGCRDMILRIVELPPPLMPYRFHINRDARWPRIGSHLEEATNGEDEHHDKKEGRKNCPDYFNRGIAMNLPGRRGPWSSAIANDKKDQDSFYYDKNNGGNDQDSPEYKAFAGRDRSGGIQNRGRVPLTTGNKQY